MQSGPKQLRDWITRRSMNQREAAEFLNITEVFLSQLLNQHRQPGLLNAVRIERLTGIPAESWLLSSVSDSSEATPATASTRKIAKR